MGDLSIGRDPQNWLVLPPEPPPQFWLEEQYTGLPASRDLRMLQEKFDLHAAGEGKPFTTEELYAYHRERGLRDLFFLAKHVLGFDRLQAELHAGLAYAWTCPDGTPLTRGPAGLYRWQTTHRGGLKTTLCSIAYAIYLLLRDPDERLLIFSSNEKMAKKIFGGVRNRLEGKGDQGEFFLTCYPELRTTKASRDKWSETMLTVPRPTPYSDASIEVSGVGATIAGSHFSTEIIDDVVGRMENSEQMNKILEVLEGLLPLSDSLETLKQRMSCTPWGMWDPGAHAERHAPEALVSRRCVFEEPDPTAPQGVRPVTNPLQFTEAKLIYRWKPDMSRTVEELKKAAKRNPFFTSCQYFCAPRVENAIGFKRSWFRYFLRRGDMLVELDHDGKEGKKTPLQACNVFIAVDPIGGQRRGLHGRIDPNVAPTMDTDYVGIAVVAVTEENIWYVLDVRRQRYNDDQFINTIFDLVAYYKPRTTCIEGTAGQRHIFQTFLSEWRRGRPVFTLGEWHGGQASKPERIRGLIPKISEGFLLFRQEAPEAIQEDIDLCIQELLDGETSQHDDAKDALSAMLQIAYPPGRGYETELHNQLRQFGEDDEILKLDAGSQRVWNLVRKKQEKRVFGLGDDFFAGGANG